jgi:hypothetical protein
MWRQAGMTGIEECRSRGRGRHPSSLLTPSTAAQVTKPTTTYYANCAAVRAAGAAPIHRGEPGYSRKLDRDGDGIACET